MTATAFAIAGSTFELLGIALVGAADYVPQVRRAAAHFARFLSRPWRWFRAKVLRRPKSFTLNASAGSYLILGGSASAVTGTSAQDIESKVDYLLRADEQTQQRLNDLEAASKRRHEELKARLGQLRGELVEDFVDALEAAFAEYITARRLGLVCLGIGLVLFNVALLV